MQAIFSCPFCGGEAKTYATLAGCTLCGACGPESGTGQRIEENWNTRINKITDSEIAELCGIAEVNINRVLSPKQDPYFKTERAVIDMKRWLAFIKEIKERLDK